MSKVNSASGAKSNRGGPRPRSGRPQSPLTKLRDDVDAKIAGLIGPEIPEIVAGLLRLAKGIYAEKEIDGQKVIVYQLPPDYKAASYLLDRVAGKPKQAVTIDPASVDIAKAVALTNQAAVEYQEPEDEGE